MTNDEMIASINSLAGILWRMAQEGFKEQGRGGLMTSVEGLQNAAANGGTGTIWLYATEDQFNSAEEIGGEQSLAALGILRRYQPAREVVIFITETNGRRVTLHTYRIGVGLAFMGSGNKEIH